MEDLEGIGLTPEVLAVITSEARRTPRKDR